MLTSVVKSPYFGDYQNKRPKNSRSVQEKNPDEVMARVRRRFKIEDVLLAQDIPKKLKEQGWVLWRIKSSEKFDIDFVLDRVNNDSLVKIEKNPKTLARLEKWLEDHQDTEKLQSFTKALANGSVKTLKWLRKHTKRTHIPKQPDLFVEEEKKGFSEKLKQQFAQDETSLRPLFINALKELGVNPEQITLSTRLKDSCCFTGCQSCLNADSKSHKLFIKV